MRSLENAWTRCFRPEAVAPSLHPMAVLLMPSLEADTPVVNIIHKLLSFRPLSPSRLRSIHDANHFLWHGQLGVNGRCERVNQFRPMVVPQPKHSATIGAEVPLGGAPLFIGSATVFDRIIFPRLRRKKESV